VFHCEEKGLPLCHMLEERETQAETRISVHEREKKENQLRVARAMVEVEVGRSA